MTESFAKLAPQKSPPRLLRGYELKTYRLLHCVDFLSKVDTTIGNLVEWIRIGDLRLPEMQRRYIWPATRVRDLLDSLYRDYPTGTILVWETDKPKPSRNLSVPQKESPFKGRRLLLDGQQRLTSLYAILLGQPVTVRGHRKPIEILFNLDHPQETEEVEEIDYDVRATDETDSDNSVEEEQEETPSVQKRLKQLTFVVASKALLADPHWVRVTDIFTKSDAQILKPLVTSFNDPEFDKYSKRLQKVRRIKDYQYVVQVLDRSLSYEQVTKIFVRVNSLGMKLRGSDLALAQITSRWRDSLRLFETFQEECEDMGFTIDIGVIVRALVVLATNQSRFRTVNTIPIDDLKSAWETEKDAIQFASNFLNANANIEDATLLSSPLFVITLAYYLVKKGKKLTLEEEQALKRWIYVASARGHYSGSSETTLDGDLAAIAKGRGAKEFLDIQRQLGHTNFSSEDLVGRGQQSPLFSLVYLALKARGAKDWRTQLGLSLTHQGRRHTIEHHHIFAKAQLKKVGYEKNEINEIANMAFISGGTNRKLSARSAEQYLAEVLKQQGEQALESHCIPLDQKLWKIESFRDFLKYRRAALAQAINDFINESNLPDIQTIEIERLITQGEGEQIEFKASARWDYRANAANKALEKVVVKSMAGFLNGKSGVIALGVDDKGTLVGLEKDYATLSARPDRDGYYQFLVNLFSSSFGRDIGGSMSVSFHQLRNHEICTLEMRKSPRPVWVEDGILRRFYVRVGNTTQELNAQEAADYIRVSWLK